MQDDIVSETMAEVKKDKRVKKEPKERKRLTPSLAPIAKIDVVKLGATENCKGCEYFLGKREKRTPHCMPCKMRFQYLFIDTNYTKGLKMKERIIDFLQPPPLGQNQTPLDEAAPMEVEPDEEMPPYYTPHTNNEIEDLFENNFNMLNI